MELIKIVGEENFCFVACEKIHMERTQMGYEDMNRKYPFVLRVYESDENYQKSLQLAESSDVAIIGAAGIIYSEIRSKYNKLTFLFRERIFKNGSLHRFFPTSAWSIYKGYTRYRSKNFYILCASAYAADDFELCGFPRRKSLKWGYFPKFYESRIIKKRSGKLKLMWCGRMIWWKHPEHAVEVARMLNEKKIDFEMLIIGNGEKESVVKSLINEYKLNCYIKLYNFMLPEDIRKNMDDSDVYLFTSGREEGWGVVLNEAMNSRCAVIANTKAGSTNYLLDNNCGFFYDGKLRNLEKALDYMLQSDFVEFGNRAYERIQTLWNAEIAAKNLIKFISNPNVIIEKGPCSLT